MAQLASVSPESGSRPISVPVAARRTGLSESTLRRALKDGQLEGYRAGERGRFLIPPAALTEWLRPAARTEDDS